MSALEEKLALEIRALKLPVPIREFRFHPTRRWRFDFAWPDLRIAVEAEGGAEMHGRRTKQGKLLKSGHLTVSGFRKDCEKYNEAAIHGWYVLRFSGAMIKDGTAIRTIERVIEVYRNEAA
jgi:very-short-patch-repair endonuclease